LGLPEFIKGTDLITTQLEMVHKGIKRAEFRAFTNKDRAIKRLPGMA
jgi:hypothetical protein